MNATSVDINILKTLQHRFPFLMVDRVMQMGERSILTRKNITMNEPVFSGHFPENPIFPGVLLIELMAQSAGLLARHYLESTGVSRRGFLVKVDKTTFHNQVVPGDILSCTVNLMDDVLSFLKFECTINKEDGSKTAKGIITLSLEPQNRKDEK